MSYTRNLIFNSMHKDWCICEGENPDWHGTEVLLDFYNGDPDVLTRCSFMVQPLKQNDNKLQNCLNVLGPVKHPAIEGQPLSHPPHLVPYTPPSPPVLPICIPVCPAGTMGGTSVGQPNAGTSALTTTSSPGVPSAPKKKGWSFSRVIGQKKRNRRPVSVCIYIFTLLLFMRENYQFQRPYRTLLFQRQNKVSKPAVLNNFYLEVCKAKCINNMPMLAVNITSPMEKTILQCAGSL